MSKMTPESRIYIAGASTSAGKALYRFLKESGYSQILEDPDSSAVKKFRPDFAFFMGAFSAGIGANIKFPADLFIRNSRAVLDFFEAVTEIRPKKILYLASSCIYPLMAPQPMKPESLGTGPLEPTSRAYAQAKLFGMELAKASAIQHSLEVITAIPADLFGPEDDFHPEHSHVTGALIRKIHEAKTGGLPSVKIWGSGNPVRDFLYSRDLARACVFLMNAETVSSPINISAGNSVSIRDWAKRIASAEDYTGTFTYDTSKPDGAPVKTLDDSALRALGWKPAFDLQTALTETFQAFLAKETAHA